MTATTARGYVYRVNADPADIAATSQALASAIDLDITATITPIKITSFGDLGCLAVIGTNTITAAGVNIAYQVCFTPKTTFTPTKFVWWCTVQSGNYDVAILNATARARLWSKGATACPVTGEVVVTMTGPPTLVAGTRYMMAIAVDNTTLAMRGVTMPHANMGLAYDGTVGSGATAASYPIPSTIGARSVDARLPAMELRA